MTEKKSAEDILNKYFFSFKDGHKEVIIKAMHEFAAQEVADYKAAIEELLPIAEAYYHSYPLESAKAIIERAKKLIKL